MSLIEKHVDDLFRKMFVEHDTLCQNPVIGGWFDKALDPVAPQKRDARRALLAREWLMLNGPRDLPPLPIHADEVADMKRGQGLRHMFGYYAQSVAGLDYAVEKHPSFDDYARGVMASPGAPDFFKKNEELRKRFPPRPLSGLDRRDLCWQPPEELAQMIANKRRSNARGARYSSATRASNACNAAG